MTEQRVVSDRAAKANAIRCGNCANLEVSTRADGSRMMREHFRYRCLIEPAWKLVDETHKAPADGADCLSFTRKEKRIR